ncbi:MAG TPA: hypothetical protein VIY27_07845 [Myxococcota bacterium]
MSQWTDEHDEALRQIMAEDIEALNAQIVDAFLGRFPGFTRNMVVENIRFIRRRTRQPWFSIQKEDLEKVRGGKWAPLPLWSTAKRLIVSMLETRASSLEDQAFNMRLNGNSNTCLFCQRGVSPSSGDDMEQFGRGVAHGHGVACPLVRVDTVLRAARELDGFEDYEDFMRQDGVG